jgi:hypothetical protein
MFAKIFKTLVGLLLIPFALGVAKAFYVQITNISIFSGALHVLENGILAYLLFHVIIARPVFIYVLGHESVHVLANWLCGGRIVSFDVSPSGGSVVTSKTNFFIELSPYFIPLYTLLLGLAYMLLKMAGKNIPHMSIVFLFLVGVTLAFHFAMTSEVLRVKQPDIVRSGLVFSAIIIFVGNLTVTMAVFAPLFNAMSFVEFLKSSWTYSAESYVLAYEKSLELLKALGVVAVFAQTRIFHVTGS